MLIKIKASESTMHKVLDILDECSLYYERAEVIDKSDLLREFSMSLRHAISPPVVQFETTAERPDVRSE